MANANLNLITTSNTFMDWLILTDNEANSINELRNGNYYKDNGNFTVANGTILITTPSGTTLSVTANALISGYLTAGNLSLTQNLVVTGGANLANTDIDGSLTLNGSNIELQIASAANTVAVLANGTLVQSQSNINFVNTSTVQVLAQANGAQVNVALEVLANALPGFYGVDVYANGTLLEQNVSLNFNNTATTNVGATLDGTLANVAFTVNTAAVLKGVVSGNTSNLSVSYNSNGNVVLDISGTSITGYSNIGVLTGSTNINVAANVYQDVMLAGNIPITFQNASLRGVASTLTLYVRQSANGGNTIAWQNTIRWSDNSVPVLSTTANTADMFTFVSFDGGTIWLGIQVMGNVPLANTWF